MTNFNNNLIAEQSSLEQRLARLEDIEAIKQLKYQYTGYCDNHYNPEGIASLFTPDGHWIVSGVGGEATGHEEIKKLFSAMAKDIIWALHYAIAPEIEVAPDGNSATGKFYLLCLCTIIGSNDRSQKDAVILTGNYVDQFVKIDGRWYFKELSGVLHQASPWTEGWVRQQWLS
jgi:uncharacterized protein (TIGR02246 family)